MRASSENLVAVDKNIKAIWDFISAAGEKPLPPTSPEGDFYTTEKLGELGEQYVQCIFKEANISRLSLRKKEPSPDFKIPINGKEFLLEVKIVRDLYKNVYQLLYELARREDRQPLYRKLESLVRNYEIKLSPSQIHYQDEQKLKNKLRKFIGKIHLPFQDRISRSFECPLNSYLILISPSKFKLPSVVWPPEGTTTLGNIISRKRRQIGNSDILAVSLINDEIEESLLRDFFYSGGAEDNSIWNLKFKTEDESLTAIREKLKCILVISPLPRKIFIFSSPKRFSDFGKQEYEYLKRYLQARKFRVRKIGRAS